MAWSDKVVEGPIRTALWEILVPTVKPPSMLRGKIAAESLSDPQNEKGLYFTTRFHRVWDAKVRAITGGLTVMQPVKGQWVNHGTDELFDERMIPVRIVATYEQIDQIIDMTLEYYEQLAVLCYKLSDEVILRNRQS